jgi:hypothetical protein
MLLDRAQSACMLDASLDDVPHAGSALLLLGPVCAVQYFRTTAYGLTGTTWWWENGGECCAYGWPLLLGVYRGIPD